MKKLLLFSMIAVFVFTANKIDAQEVKKLTFDEVIKLSEEQSPNALMAKHRFRASYWQYRTFVAQYRPSLHLPEQPLITVMPMIKYGIHRLTHMSTDQQILLVILVLFLFLRILD